MSLSSYLHKRPQSANWQLRMMIPKAARPVLGRTEFTRSLGVPDRRRAEALAYPVLAEWKARVTAATAPSADQGSTALRKPYSPTPAELEEAALVVGYEEAGRRVNDLITAKARLGTEAYHALSAEIERRHMDALRHLHAGDHSYWIERARKQIAKRNWHLPEGSELFASFVQAMARCGVDLFASARLKLAGNESSFVPSADVQKATERRQSRAKDGEGILDLFQRYQAQRLAEGLKRADSLNQDRKVVELLVEFVGKQRSLASIQKDELREWRNAPTTLPPAFKKRKAFAEFTMRQAAYHAAAAGETGLSLNTINRYLSAVSALFIWATREGYVDGNPCDGLFYDHQKGKNARPPFSVEQLNKIIASPLFNGFERDGKEFNVGGCRADDWRYWLPLVCLFTGARIGEVAQLNIADVRSEGSLWWFDIKSDEGLGQVTKNNTSRVAPMHSKLRQIGFLDFVKRQTERARGALSAPLFPELTRNDRGQLAMPSRFWRTYLERIGVKQGKDGFGSHSFRHGLADQLRAAGCFDNEVAVAIGHKQSTVTSGYGRTRQGSVEKLNQMIEGATFEGVDFTALKQNAQSYPPT
jgi:integrase